MIFSYRNILVLFADDDIAFFLLFVRYIPRSILHPSRSVSTEMHWIRPHSVGDQ